MLNGISVYLAIPLLDTLFQESASKQTTVQTSSIEKTSGILPDWVNNLKEDLNKVLFDLV